MPTSNAPQLTPTEAAVIDMARAALHTALALLPEGSALRRSYHSALCESERAIGRAVSMPGRKEREQRREN